MDIIKIKVIRSGQARAYQDSVYEYEIDTTPGDDATAWDTIQSAPHLKRATHRKDTASHNGACAFEFGLSSYGSLRSINPDGTKWKYVTTHPYCD